MEAFLMLLILSFFWFLVFNFGNEMGLGLQFWLVSVNEEIHLACEELKIPNLCQNILVNYKDIEVDCLSIVWLEGVIKEHVTQCFCELALALEDEWNGDSHLLFELDKHIS
uniref:Uncharacterized protein n=1 Tax=Rhizophagus irregularis (strain DAOM 181602 / DAOM 197198 / MUCL 43194) TaxID=747089 RepID=U9UL75_RHIID